MNDDEPSPNVMTLLGASGACPEIRANGKVWRIGHPTGRAKSELEQLAVLSAFAEVRSLKDVLPPDAYAEAFRELTASVAAKSYKTWGEGWQRVVWGPASSHLFLLSLLRENHPQATEDDARALAVAEPEAVALALTQVVPSFIRLLLNDRKDITPEQREQAMRVVNERLGTLTPPPPAPIPATSAGPSASGTKRSPKSRG